MDLETCGACNQTGPSEEYDVCSECKKALCETCGDLTTGRLLCKKCKEKEEEAEFEAELNADFDYTPEGSVGIWEEEEDGKSEQSRT